MHTAVAQLVVVQRRLLHALACDLSHAGNRLALLLVLLDFLQQHVGGGWGLVQVVIELFLDEVVNELVDGGSVFPHHA